MRLCAPMTFPGNQSGRIVDPGRLCDWEQDENWFQLCLSCQGTTTVARQ